MLLDALCNLLVKRNDILLKLVLFCIDGHFIKPFHAYDFWSGQIIAQVATYNSLMALQALLHLSCIGLLVVSILIESLR